MINKSFNEPNNNCSVCNSDKIRYETVTACSQVFQQISGKTVISLQYQDIEYKICDSCGDRRTNFFTY